MMLLDYKTLTICMGKSCSDVWISLEFTAYLVILNLPFVNTMPSGVLVAYEICMENLYGFLPWILIFWDFRKMTTFWVVPY